jgi:cytochrome c
MRRQFTLPLLLTTLTLLIFSTQVFAQTSSPAKPAPAKANTAKPSSSKGQRLFLLCASCHEISDSAVIKTGPNLKGIVGRQVASYPGYVYSKSLQAQSFAWDDAQLDRWLQQPTAIAAGTTMAFIGMPKPEDRKALIVYLKAAQ